MAILIVDDSRDSRRLMEILLKSAGYEDVLTASSAQEAYGFFPPDEPDRHENIDLILMDIVMPDIDGIEACRQIKMTQAADVPIIMVTAKTDKEELNMAFAAGAMDYLTKPVDRVELVARVRSALKLKQETDRRRARELDLLKVTKQLAEANETLKQLSLRDGLTGVANRRHFDEVLADEWRRAQRYGHPLSVALLDVDYFKNYNDTYGHLRGDDCLRLVAETAQSTLRRPGDFIARYGGEEFALILPDTPRDGASSVVEGVRSAIEQLRISHVTSLCKDVVTVSIGIATFNLETDMSLEDLMKQADAALYRAKADGRNRMSS